MHIKQLHTIKQQGQEQANGRFTQGQIVRGRVVQLYPKNLVRIEIGSFQFIAQLETPLEHGERYFFQVKDIKQHVHLQVIQQLAKPSKNEWQQLLEYMGIKQTKMHEQLIERMIQAEVPFTNRTFQQAVTLLATAPDRSLAMDTLIHMMKRKMPVTNEIFQSLMTFQSSTWTDQLMHTYKELMHKNPHVNEQLFRQLDMWLPVEKQMNKVFAPLHRFVMTHTDLSILHQLRWVIPQIDPHQVRQLEQLSLANRKSHLHTPAQLIAHLGMFDGSSSKTSIQTFQVISSSTASFQSRVTSFAHLLDRVIQTDGRVDQATYANILRAIETFGSINGFPHAQMDSIRQQVPSHVQELEQMMNDLKGLSSTLHQLGGEERQQPTNPRSQLAHVITNWLKYIGHSYERAIAEGQIEPLMDSLKGQLLQVIQAEGIGADRAQSLLHYIQGMQLQTVQETTHMLSVQIQLPAVIGALRSDLHIQFEGKKTRDNSIDPDYCRIVFDLDLAAMERTFIDMHIQNKQVSFIIYNDFPVLKKIAQAFERSLVENLREMDYIVTSIRYQPMQEKPKHASHVRQEKEGIDLKV